MKIYRYLLLALLTFVFATTIEPVVAQMQTSLNPLVTSRVNVNAGYTLKQSDMLLEGKGFYEAGRLVEATQVWEKALSTYQRKGELRNQVLVYNYLSVAYQDLGDWQAAKKSVSKALELIKTVDDGLLYAQVLNTSGSLQLKTGNPQIALDSWKQSEQIYRKLDDATGIILSQINQAQALQNLGFYRRGRNKLEQVAKDLDKLPDSLLKARGLRSLGNVLQAVGDLDNSQKVLSQSLEIARNLNGTPDVAQSLLALGNTVRVNDDYSGAIDYYQQAAVVATDSPTQLSAKINQFSLLLKTKKSAAALELLPDINQLLTKIPSSRFSVYSRVNLAESLIKNKQLGVDNRELGKILAIAVKQARELQDKRAEAYAVGQLGHVYEENKQFSEALNLTRNGLTLAQSIQSNDISATLLWQQGRIYKAL
ncbi:MAG: tetratricopeptide repeat protein [Cyanobacteria bacterium J06649_11]